MIDPSSPTARPAPDEWLPQVYEELRTLARREMSCEAEPQTLQTTALVHEAYLRLFGAKTPDWNDRAHFFGAAARAMRQILVDRARARRAVKRGDGARRIGFEQLELARFDEDPERLLSLDRALTRLEALDERKARIVMLRFFSGLSIAETARVLEVSPTTVKDDWQFARSWLQREMSA